MRGRCLVMLLSLLAIAPAAVADNLSASATGDIDGDGVPDRIDVRRAGVDMDEVIVSIFLSRTKHTIRAERLTITEEVDRPEVEKGELHLSFLSDSHRTKVREEFFVGLEDPALVVRRYNLYILDSGQTDDKGNMLEQSCSLDFIANKAVRNKQPDDPPGPAIAFDKWAQQSDRPAACRF
jgi:hypothetical protein